MHVVTAATAGMGGRVSVLLREAQLVAEARLVTELSRSQTRNIRTIDNIITHNAKATDFSGVAAERAGLSTPKSPTVNWNHIQEMRRSIDGLQKSVRGLEGSLHNPHLSPAVRATIERSLLRARMTIERMERALAGGGP